MFSHLKHGEKLAPYVHTAEELIQPRIKEIEKMAEYNQAKVLQAFQRNKVSDFHFNASTGYGYNDTGRETLEKVYAEVFGGEAALVRHHIISGTHALSISLFGLLRPGEELMYITGSSLRYLRRSHRGARKRKRFIERLRHSLSNGTVITQWRD